MLDCGEKELEAKGLGTGPQQAAVEVAQGGDNEELNRWAAEVTGMEQRHLGNVLNRGYQGSDDLRFPAWVTGK